MMMWKLCIIRYRRPSSFSSNLFFSSNETTAIVDGPVLGQVISRRVWQKQHLRKVRSNPVFTKENTNEKSQPWPNSIRYGAVAFAAVVIPYVTTWIIISYPNLRTRLLTKSQIESLRRHFGTLEPTYISYTETLTKERVSNSDLIPAVLPGERSPAFEATQEAIDGRSSKLIRVELSAHSSSSNGDQSTVCLKLPGSERANAEILLQYLQDVLSNGIVDGVVVTVDFPDDDDDVAEANFEMKETDSPKQSDEDPLLRTTPIYSSWYYQPPMLNATDVRTSHQVASSLVTNEELQVRQLQAEIAKLEKELKDLHSTRPFDDIQDELNHSRSQLCRIKWRRWMPW